MKKAPSMALRVKTDIFYACRMLARQIRVKNTFTAAHLLKPYLDKCVSGWSLRGRLERFISSGIYIFDKVIKIQINLRKYFSRFKAFKKIIR